VNASREISQVASSPAGTLVAMSVAETAPDGTKTAVRLWLVDAAVPEGARPITRGDKRASSPAFSPDGRRLAYLVEGDKEPLARQSPGDGGKMQLAALTTPFSEPIVLTHFEQGVRSFEWLDAKRLLVLAPPDRPEAKRKAVEQKDDAYVVESEEPCARMWLVNVSGGRPKPIGPAGGHVVLASTSPAGRLLAYLHAAHSTLESFWRGSELRLLDLRTGRSRLLRRLYSPQGHTPRFSPDGRRLAFVDCPRRGALYPAYVFVADLSLGKTRGGAGPSVRRIRRAAPGSTQVQTAPRWLDNNTVLFVEQRGVRRALCAAEVGPDGSGREVVRLPGSVGDYAVTSGGRVAFVYSESAKPPEVFESAATGASAPEKLTAINRALDAVALSPGEIIRWTSRDGRTVEGLLHRPTTKARAPYPCCVVPHGGPHGAISDAWERPLAQVLAARGVASFFPNFRGSTGYGEEFLLSIRGDWGKGPADDIMRGVETLVRRRVADRGRLVVQGGSYGGFMTAWLIGHYDVFRAAVASAPVVHNLSMWGTTDIPVFQEWELRTSPLKDPGLYWRLSPVKWLARCRVPTLVIVGDKDERVPPGQAQELYRTLKSAGAPARLVRYPREPHGIGEPRHKSDMMRRIVAWFDEHLGKT